MAVCHTGVGGSPRTDAAGDCHIRSRQEVPGETCRYLQADYSGGLRLRPVSWLALPLAILAGLPTLGSTMCGGDPAFEVESLRWVGTPRWVSQWSPDGNHIVFEGSELGKSSGIYIVRSDGSRLRRISASSGELEIDYWPDISPDGSRVVYTTSRHRTTEPYRRVRRFEIETSKLDGSDRRRLTKNSVHDVSPVWSPDGSRIAFRNLADGDEIVVMAADGSDKRNFLASRTLDPGDFDLEQGAVVAVGSVIAGPAWSPDGETISFVGSAYIEKAQRSGQTERSLHGGSGRRGTDPPVCYGLRGEFDSE